jgi:hypothetical protein
VRRLIALAALVGAAVVVSSAGAITAPPLSFSDPSGDAGTAPDITSISVTNDDHGQYTITLTFATPYGNAAGALIFLDTDQNASTGSVDGAEYAFADDHASHSFVLYSWGNGTWNQTADSTAAVTIANDNMSIMFTVNKSEIGNSTRFNFFAISIDGDGADGHFDAAPSGSGDFTYNSQTVFTLSLGATHDGAAKAGGTWTVSMSAVRSDTKTAVGSEASIACSAKDGSKKLAVVQRAFVGTSAVCTFRVPKTPKHASLLASVSVTDGGQTLTKGFTATTR